MGSKVCTPLSSKIGTIPYWRYLFRRTWAKKPSGLLLAQPCNLVSLLIKWTDNLFCFFLNGFFREQFLWNFTEIFYSWFILKISRLILLVLLNVFLRLDTFREKTWLVNHRMTFRMRDQRTFTNGFFTVNIWVIPKSSDWGTKVSGLYSRCNGLLRYIGGIHCYDNVRQLMHILINTFQTLNMIKVSKTCLNKHVRNQYLIMVYYF